MNGRGFLLFLLLLSHFPGSEAKPSQEAVPDPKTQRRFDIKIREASAAFDKEDYATSRKKMEEADGLIPNETATLNLRGILLYKERKYDEALAVFQALIDQDANSYPGYFNTAEVWLAQKKYDQALAGFERILQARPGDEICQFRIVFVLALQGKLDQARQRAKKIPNPGQTAAYYFAQAAIELITGHAEKGRAWLKQSEAFFPAENSTNLRSILVEHHLIEK